MRPAAILLHGAAATNPRFRGTGCSGQWGSPNEVRASGAPLRQAAEGRRPQRYMLAPKRPTLCEGDQLLVGGLYQDDGELHRLYIVSCQSCFHCSIRLKLEFARDDAWRLKGRRERRRWRLRFWAVAMRACKRWEVFSRAFLISVDVWCSLRSAGGAIPERTERYFTGVGRRQPWTILMVSLRVTSRFFYVDAEAAYFVASSMSWMSKVENLMDSAPTTAEISLLVRQMWVDNRFQSNYRRSLSRSLNGTQRSEIGR